MRITIRSSEEDNLDQALCVYKYAIPFSVFKLIAINLSYNIHVITRLCQEQIDVRGVICQLL